MVGGLEAEVGRRARWLVHWGAGLRGGRYRRTQPQVGATGCGPAAGATRAIRPRG
jgi:hypothetical protein